MRKQISKIYQGGQPHFVGDGFRVTNLFPNGNKLGKEMSPFYLMDYAAPAYFPPSDKPRGVGAHPHKGFETVTIVYQGALEHRDSAGNSGKLYPGDVQWMTAGAGILHEEKHETEFSKKGGKIEMMQLWVNLPKKDKSTPPAYQELSKDNIPVIRLDEQGSYLRVIAGEHAGIKGAASTFTPVYIYDVKLEPGTALDLQLPASFNTGIVALEGVMEINSNQTIKAVELALFEHEGEEIKVEAKESSRLLVLSGEPINEPIFAYGPFLMNSSEDIVQALQEFESGKMGVL
ncbi:hypothetical protein COR50_06875 [Chitinophaga caeni]|uniref:Short-chain dehydrogenase n=1 Tax=Chitinophaga caeni TaxID=2029983 RepID=A0A291QSJ7_9BACT|nr:pirin family protein [Chitinophaga caeni]ATL46926.1 hypothetical protein COR50_06875 [Chitinophaga caeni]